MALSTAGLQNAHNFQDIAKVFQDTARTVPITVADGSQLVRGATDDSGNARHLTSDTGIGYRTTGSSRALVFSGTQYTALASFGGSSQYNQSSASPIGFSFDIAFVMPSQTVDQPQSIFALGHSSGSSRFDVRLNPDRTFGVVWRPSSGGTPPTAVFGTWEFDTPYLLQVRKLPDGTLVARVNGVSVTVTQSAPFTGTTSFNRMCIGAYLSSGYLTPYTGRVFGLRGYVGRSDADFVADGNEQTAALPTYAAVPAISVTGAQDVRAVSWLDPVIDLAGSIANVPGTPASLLVRVFRERDGLEVKPFTNTGATFAGLNFTGGVLNGLPADYGLRRQWQVRDAGGNVLATIDGGVTFLVGDVFAGVGSSTTQKAGDEGAGNADPRVAILNIQTETAWRINDTLGSGWHAFADAWVAATGRPCAIVNGGKSSTALDEWINNSGGIMSVMANAWAKYKPRRLTGVTLGAGANDTFKPFVATNPQTVRSRQSHQGKLGTLLDNLLAAMGGQARSSVAVTILGINNRTTDASNEADPDGNARPTMARGAEVAFARTLPKGWYINSMDAPTLAGDIHLADAGQVIVFGRAGKAQASAVTGQTAHPTITLATLDATGADLTVRHTTGTDFGPMPSGGWVGFKVYDNLGNVQTVTATRKNATTLRLNFTVDPARAYLIGHLNGTRTTPQTSIVLDNSNPPLSLEPTITAVGEVLVGGQRLTVSNVWEQRP